MMRTLLTALLLMSALTAPVFAEESASDATTTMDKQLGNQEPPKNNTLSNDEIKRLQNHPVSGTGMQEQTTGATVTTSGTKPIVSGTTPNYDHEVPAAAGKTEQ